jgi:hypothetical protein
MTKSIEKQTTDAVLTLGMFIDKKERTREEVVFKMMDLMIDNTVHAFECLTDTTKGLYLADGHGIFAAENKDVYSLYLLSGKAAKKTNGTFYKAMKKERLAA